MARSFSGAPVLALSAVGDALEERLTDLDR
jgi:hypothetical protein